MEKQRKIKLMWRWSLVSAGIIGLFLLIWYLAAGSVPKVTEIQMTETWTIQLPFGISRWWDILIGPIWSVLLIIVFTNNKISKNNDMVAGLVVGLVFGLIFGLGTGLGAGLAAGLVFGLVAGLVFGLGAGLVLGLVFGLVLGLVFGLGAGLAAGLVFGLAFGLGAGLVLGLVFGLGAGLGAIVWSIKKLTSLDFWRLIGRWLLARESV